ncbi:hypothetical protein CHU67_00400 [Corynebacterium sp. LK19]|nr:hypothetical protein CHU67_00400 [Corynebacterium sp. LK19]
MGSLLDFWTKHAETITQIFKIGLIDTEAEKYWVAAGPKPSGGITAEAFPSYFDAAMFVKDNQRVSVATEPATAPAMVPVVASAPIPPSAPVSALDTLPKAETAPPPTPKVRPLPRRKTPAVCSENGCKNHAAFNGKCTTHLDLNQH